MSLVKNSPPRRSGSREKVAQWRNGGHSDVDDLGPQHVQALTDEGGKGRPALGRDHVAVDQRLGGREVDIFAAGEDDLGLAGTERGNALAAYDAIVRDEDLHAMADRENRLLGLMEVPHDSLHALVGTDVLRPAAARAVDGIVFSWTH